MSPDRPTRPATDPAMLALSESAQRIQNTWNELGAVERSKSPEYMRFADDFETGYPYQLDNLVDVNYGGPIEQLVDSMARSAGYDFNVVGGRPVKPVLVYVRAKDSRIGDILRDVGYQAGSRAGVVIHPRRYLIALVYVPTKR
mgnify:FL=1